MDGLEIAAAVSGFVAAALAIGVAFQNRGAKTVSPYPEVVSISDVPERHILGAQVAADAAFARISQIEKRGDLIAIATFVTAVLAMLAAFF